MAEIRSTIDLVMERAAKMGRATPEEMELDSANQKGRQYAAEYLNEKKGPLTEMLAKESSNMQNEVRKGMLDVLLRNLFLARDDPGFERVGCALTGLIELGGGGGDIAGICQELQGIIGQYSKHRKQYYEQLKEQILMQIEQVVAMKTGSSVEGLNIDPTIEPKFKEEWARIEGELNGQYEQVLNQYREQLSMRLGA
ncbi:MAG: hypothetical protein CSA32_03390 [Desulfobulbus propionicus]|nr:MAG: hypothetical protein CSA32_03390 [Desulfobulbus propionicus]